jgi:DNA mismatch repair protein MutS2
MITTETLSLLEFDSVLKELRDLAVSAEGYESFQISDSLLFHYEKNRLSNELDVVAEIRRIIQDSVSFPGETLPDIRKILGAASKEGAVLDPEELSDIARYLEGAASILRAVRSTTENEDLQSRCADVPDCTEIVRSIRRVIDNTGQIRIENIPELRKIRDQSSRAKNTLEAQALKIIRSSSRPDIWTGDLPIQRDGRTVVPVAVSHRSSVQGIVHESSGTGKTVYIEPIELIEQNNIVTELEDRFRRELHRILKDLTRVVTMGLKAITRVKDEVTYLDIRCSAARYSIRHGCHRAEISDRSVRLVNARHPLLGSQAVPVQLEISQNTRTLVITGPNTGGKTVGLKTVGVLCLMQQFGLEVPADPGTRLPLCDSVFVDIGDDQSIEKSLSTFSGHMRRIAGVLDGAGSRSLVLLDELGSGTDPAEGAALAMGVLDALQETGCLTIITTHNGGLKQYAYTRSCAENASVEFDESIMAPTYKIIQGSPGGSHAMEIAERSGIPFRVLTTARRYLIEGAGETETIIAGLEKTRAELDQEKRELEEVRAGLARDSAALSSRKSELDRREIELRSGSLREMQEFVAATRSNLENLVKELREGEINREKTRKTKEFIRDMEARLREESREMQELEMSIRDRKGVDPRESGRDGSFQLDSGQSVRISGTKQAGIIERRNRNGTWVVRAGGVHLNVPEDKLERVPEKASGSRSGGYTRTGSADGTDRGIPKPVITVEHSREAPVFELDLRGMRHDEALNALDRHLDRCILEAVHRFGVIHGTGEGVLQKAVRARLAELPSVVRSFEYAPPEDGGFGKTIVTLAVSNEND